VSKERASQDKALEANTNQSIKEQINNFNFDTLSFDRQPPDTQVKMKQQRAPKRKFTNTYKLQILNEFDACKNSEERGTLLRREGLYYARISAWKKQVQQGKSFSSKTPKSILLNQQLAREVASLKKKLLQAEAIIDLQKKVSELLSMNILNHDMNETSS